MSRILALACLTLLSASIEANEARLELGGFGSFGATLSDSDVYGYQTDISQTKGAFDGDLGAFVGSAIGVQLDYSVSDSLDVVTQAVYRGQEDVTLNRLVTQAFVRYIPSINWNIRLGRTPFDLFHLSEYRDIRFAYNWAHVPTEVYGLIPMRYVDGIDLIYQNQLGGGTFRTKSFFGSSEGDQSIRGNPEVVKIKKAYGAGFEYELQQWSFEANYSFITLEDNLNDLEDLVGGIRTFSAFLNQPPLDAFDLWPDAEQLASDLSIKNRDTTYGSVSARFSSNDWSFVSEYAQTRADGVLIPDVDSGFLTLVRKMGDYSVFTSGAIAKSDPFEYTPPFDPNNPLLGFPPQLIAGANEVFSNINGATRFYAPNQSTLSIGGRWDISNKLALTVQWDHTDIEAQGGTLWETQAGEVQSDETVNILHVNVSFIF